MDNNLRKQKLDELKTEISICNVKIICIIIAFGILIYNIDDMFLTILSLLFAISFFLNNYKELENNINSYNQILCSKNDINKTNITTTVPTKNNKTPQNTSYKSSYYPDITRRSILFDNYDKQNTDNYFKEENYCEICGKLLTDAEYYEYDCYCEDCYSDINVDYQLHGLTDYNKPFIDVIDDSDVYNDFFNQNDYDDNLFDANSNDDLFSDDFDEF